MAPAVAGDVVVIGSCEGTIHGLDKERGESHWSYDTRVDGTAAQFHGEALLRDGIVFIGADGPPRAHLYALEAATGNLAWKRPFPHGVPTRVLGFDGSLAFVTGDGVLVSADPKDGSTRWQFEPEGTIPGRQRISAASMGESVVFHAADGDVHVFDASSGKEQLRIPIGTPPSADPVVGGGRIYVATESGHVIRIDGRSGDVVAKKRLNGRIYGSLQSDGERIFALVAGDARETLVALDPLLEAAVWEQAAEAWSSFRPLVRGGVITVGGSNLVCSFRTEDGEAVDCVPIDGTVRGIGHDERRLFIGTVAGKVVALPLLETEPAR
ncbi:MAG TPA: PQQ-binding-like beta-propeller repeat protein [Thermoanaerobaculia bacterium]|nr:PQQ-binding-like beta-propeller repeat protein [Thermoanaerobaculia bacterium]